MIGFPLPPVGSIASFQFIGAFSVLNEIYKITKISSFEQAQADDVDLDKLLYAPANVDFEQYDAHYPTYENRPVLHLTKINNDSLESFDIIVPEVLLLNIPDQDILKAHDLFLDIDLGMFTDHTQLLWLVSHVEDVVASATGTMKNSTLISNKTVYVTRTEYDALNNSRLSKLETVESLTILNQRNAETIRKLQTYVDALEQQLKDISSA
jgi:hypothetical protein